MNATVRGFFVGGPADGMVREFDSRPPDRMQATPEGQGQLIPGAAPTIYTRNDLTGGTVIYVPAGTLLHDAFVRVLDSYAEARQLDKLSDEHNRVGG
ncbi:hypothetical protein Salvo_28 [Xylella phage Salvo]|uniref:Uncharacterized protein n=1 Tax=Xylella phage Salvo TaxID=1415147 RepID=V5Q807_9CAUD|nr:hypothetical protein FGG49_gp28 [Xylella phage Salvo]AHB12228.1 hypothetical protein Salvo_28 [Xylella phage Salvo]